MIQHAFREFEARSIFERLQTRVHDPAVRMPAVPVLLCENPIDSGVLSVTLHPGAMCWGGGAKAV